MGDRDSTPDVGSFLLEGGGYEEIQSMQGGPVTGGGFRRYGLKVRPGFVPKVLTSDPVNGESRSARSRGRMEGRPMVTFFFVEPRPAISLVSG